MLLSAFLWCNIIFVSMLHLPSTCFIISWFHICLVCALQAVVYEVVSISIDTSPENLTTLFYYCFSLSYCIFMYGKAEWTLCTWPLALPPAFFFFFKDGPSCIPQCNPFKLGHTLDIANMYRGMHAAREVGVPPGSFTQTQSCAQLRLTGGCNTCGKF